MLCESEQSLLLIVDIQQRLAGAMPPEVMNKVIHNSHILLQAADSLRIPVIHSEQYPQGLGSTVEELDAGKKRLGEPFVKTCFACTDESGFIEKITGFKRKQIIITGIESHICILQTALQLRQQGYEVFVVADATCSRKKEHYKNAMARLLQQNVIVSNTESVLFEWLRDAKHNEFKTLSKLIR